MTDSERLPILVSVPHAGLTVPPEVADRCKLTLEEIAKDGDEGAAVIYDFPEAVASYVRTDIARAIVDQNRAPDDFRKDGVIKTHTCWDVPVWRDPLDEALEQSLIQSHWAPYHQRLRDEASGKPVGIDCHTMAAFGPPVAPDPGVERPWICLGNGDGTCPDEWLESLAECFAKAFDCTPSLNVPFRGGYIVRSHAAEIPWIQLELSRAPFRSDEEKRAGVLEALRAWCRKMGWATIGNEGE